MEFKIKVRIHKDLEFTRTDLDVSDFKDCDTVESLKRCVRNKLLPPDIGYDSIISEEFELEQEFIDDWKSYVGFIPDNVMSYKCAEERKAMSETTRVISGEALENYKHEHNWNPFELSMYRDFKFDEKAKYKCYLKDVDHYEFVSTILLYAEKMK